MRKSTLVWASVSASRLLGIEAYRAGGLPLEAVSQSLASILYRMKSFGETVPQWQPDPDLPENSYRILVNSDANFTLLQILPCSLLTENPPYEKALKERNTAMANRKIEFSRLLEITEGDPVFLKDLIPSYLEALRECRTQFRRGLDEKSPEKIRFLHHKIKATIRTFGLHDLEDIFQRSLKHVKSDQPSDESESTIFMAQLNSVCTDAEDSILEFARQNNLYL